ncbi:MAG: 16S rRNA (cytosine(967)-C(5))-methyltransferase RsmB [Actinomycetota bacterium]
MNGSARATALEVVRRVTEDHAYSNLLLPTLLERSGLSLRDRALATELAYGTLRRLIPLDHALGRFLERPLDKAEPVSRAALRLGSYQLLFTRVPAHAAVGETVGLVPERQRGFVNAVLRKVSGSDRIVAEGEDHRAISLRTGLSEWAVAELGRLVGAEVEAAAAALASQESLTIRSNPCVEPLESMERALGDRGIAFEQGSVNESSLLLRGASPSELPGFSDGWFAVQDQASSYVVSVLDPQPGELVLDACASPGGKASDIACRSGSVVAADLTHRRATLLRGSLQRLRADARILVQDATTPALRSGFDRVLVDAPCSGIGAARRRPELLWRPDKRELSRLARLQVSIALGAASLLRPGGVLVYSVCTFPRGETDAVCEALLAKAPYLEPFSFSGPEGKSVSRARLWPHTHGTDAMFVARFRRTDESAQLGD